ncbi:phenylalanine--tRNA ligase subunit beta [Ihubacter sp. rT4E-8]|uniref:phenylalanine--tRNA ligase subunit beta n=1 Tax=Ihubacter sp. rT4E-8 TaxID=3242369 RepID=UPI003CF43287
MLVSLNWLKDYTDVNVPIEEFCNRMIMSGSDMETCEELGTGIQGVVVGRIDKIEQHPDADKLVVCQINIGEEEPLQIVTGATNIYEGGYCPIAKHNSHIPGPLHGQPKVEGGVKITKGKLRGVVSNGMMCGPQELGIEDKIAPYISKDGIWMLPGNWDEHLGEDFVEALGLHDYAIDFCITPNRPDCLCMLGMAKEAAAVFEEKMTYPENECEKTDENASDYISVEVRNENCLRYTARVIKDVKIEQSPWWLQKRLMAAGMRPINNMVDITNFVMMEYGQPLHAFDIRSVAGSHIIVDVAKDGDKFTTLDGQERDIYADTLMINDAEKPIGIAGIMGGLNSEIVDDTNTVLVESACFDKNSIHRSMKKLDMRTEASARYERGLDPNLAEAAADRVCKLVEMLGCGKVLNGSVDVYHNPQKPVTISCRVSKVNKVLGTEIPREEMEGYFKRLDMEVAGEGDIMLVTPPTVRQDMKEEIDCVEEVARLYGFDNLPMTLPKADTVGTVSKSWALRDLTRNLLCGMGLNEIQTYSFSNQKILDNIGIEEDSWERNLVEIINPMGEETAAMRTLLTPGMLEVLGRNYARNIDRVGAYEIALTFMNNLMDANALPVESYNLSLGLYGKDEDFFTLKGIICTLLERLGIKELEFTAESDYKVYHPGRCARILTKDINGQEVELGIMGEVHPDVSEKYGIGTRAYVSELFFDVIVELSNREILYHQPPKYPSTSRDIAMIVDEDTLVGDMEKKIREAGKELLRDVKLFDVYRGKQVDEGKKSVAFSLTYRHDDRTLTDEEADSVHANVVDALKEAFQAVIRES